MSELLYKIDMMTIKTMEAFADDLLPMADEFKGIPKDHFIVSSMPTKSTPRSFCFR